MKLRASIVLFSTVSVSLLQAQPAVPGGSSDSRSGMVTAPVGDDSTTKLKADQDWNTLQSSINSARVNVPQGGKLTPAQSKNEKSRGKSAARAAAGTARAFYTAYPAHENAGAAKKLEASLALQAVDDDDPAYEQAAKQIARTFREDVKNKAEDRFEVALVLERVQSRASLGQKIYGNSPTVLERIAEQLRREFPDLAQPYENYMAVARMADMATAKRIAGNILLWNAPAEAKREAQTILERDALLGKSLKLILPAINSLPVDLAEAGNGTVVLLWSPHAPGSISALAAFKDFLPPGVRVVYLAPGGTIEQARAAMNQTSLGGIHCIDSTSGMLLSEYLGVSHTPFVYVINRAGLLSGFGPISEFPALLPALMH